MRTIRYHEFTVNGLNFRVKRLPDDWKGATKKIPGGTGVVQIWSSPEINGKDVKINMFIYPDGKVRGRGVRQYKELVLKVLDIYTGGGKCERME